MSLNLRIAALCVVAVFAIALAVRAQPPVISAAALTASAGVDEFEDEEEGDGEDFADEGDEEVDEEVDEEDVVDEEIFEDEDAVDEEATDEDEVLEDETLDDDALDDDALEDEGAEVEPADDEVADENGETGEEAFIEDFEDDAAWAPEIDDEIEFDESDDAIAFDERFDESWVWEVESVTDARGVVEDTGLADDEDGVAMGQMLQIRGSRRSQPAGDTSRGASSRRPRQQASAPARASTRGEGDDDDVPYAFGGRPVAARAVPWQAQIFNPDVVRDPANPKPIWMRQHNCGGALIADDWVLTAAHCIDQQAFEHGVKVRLGAQDLSLGDGHVYRIERFIRHSQYNRYSQDLRNPPNMYANDIALIRIVPDGAPRPRDPRFIRPIALNRKPLGKGLPVSVTGWGAVGAGETQAANAIILRVDLRLMDNATCSARPKRAGKIGPGVFCAASPTQSTCSGDSGGPVVPTNSKTPVLAGLVSWGSTRCGGDGRPGVYTRIDQHIDWIEQAMRLPPTRNSFP